MVRFEENKLVIEIPCHEGEIADYYTGLQNALYGVYWLATAKHNESEIVSDELNWIATYLGPAIAELEPAAKLALNSLRSTSPDRNDTKKKAVLEDLIQRLNKLSEPELQILLRLSGMSNLTEIWRNGTL